MKLMNRLKRVAFRLASWQAGILLCLVFFSLAPLWVFFVLKKKNILVHRGWRRWKESSDTLEDLERQ